MADAEEAFLHHRWVNSYPQALAILLLVNTLAALEYACRTDFSQTTPGGDWRYPLLRQLIPPLPPMDAVSLCFVDTPY